MRLKRLTVLQEHYEHFVDFLHDGMEWLGFSTTEIQEDIGRWLEHGPQYLMVQAQRGQAKTTICALFAVWCLIHDPKHRVLIISAGGTQAVEISTLIVRLIMNMDTLECLRPDKMAGDRTSVEAFDIHHSLKGVDKSPSVACVGIDSNLQGKRAHLLIPDDVESSKNSATQTQRAKLLHLTKDFTSINSTGRILWLGTPQSMDSIYNSLPGRGVVVRIWPGRYPTEAQRAHYGNALAPLLSQRLAENPALGTGGGLLGDQGQPVDPVILDEAKLQAKERDQGPAYFQLQHMLNTAMSDALRYPLKPTQLVVMDAPVDKYPLVVTRGMEGVHLRDFAIADFGFKMTGPQDVSRETSKLQICWAYVDPAAGGANADETAACVGGFLNGNVYLLGVRGQPGGYELEKLTALAEWLCQFPLDGVTIEKNMGYGAFKAVFQPILAASMKKRGKSCAIEEDLVTGQKEARIINTLAPIMGRGSLIVSPRVVEDDMQDIAGYAPQVRLTYSLFYQMAKLTQTSNALIHDDRLDALEGLCRKFSVAIAQDQKKQTESLMRKEHERIMKNPLCYPVAYKPPGRSMLKRKR